MNQHPNRCPSPAGGVSFQRGTWSHGHSCPVLSEGCGPASPTTKARGQQVPVPGSAYGSTLPGLSLSWDPCVLVLPRSPRDSSLSPPAHGPHLHTCPVPMRTASTWSDGPLTPTQDHLNRSHRQAPVCKGHFLRSRGWDSNNCLLGDPNPTLTFHHARLFQGQNGKPQE